MESNLTKVTWLNFAWMFLVLMPVIVPYFQSRGLSMRDVYLLQTFFAVCMVAMEAPTGYLADLLGRRRCLIVAGALNGVGFLWLTQAEGFWSLALFEFVVAIAQSLYSGTDVAILYDSLEAMPHRPVTAPVGQSVLGKRVFSAQLGETIAALVGGWVAMVSFSATAWVSAAAACVPFFIALTLTEPPRAKLDARAHLQNLAEIARELFRASPLLRQLLWNHVFFGFTTLLAVWVFQDYWRALGVPIGYFGYLWAGYNLAVALTARVAHRWESHWSVRRAAFWIGMLSVAGYVGMACFTGAIGVLAGLCFQVSRGFNQVILRDAINVRVKASMRATANSVASLGSRLVFAAVGPFFGALVDSRGHGTAFAAAAVGVALVGGISVFLLAKPRRAG